MRRKFHRIITRFYTNIVQGKREVILGALIVLPLLGLAILLMTGGPYSVLDATSSSTQPPATSRSDHTTYVRAAVLAVKDKVSDPNASGQTLTVRLLDGDHKDSVISVDRYNLRFGDNAFTNLPLGSQVLLFKNIGSPSYSYIDRYRIPGASLLLIALLLLVVVIARWRGITAFAGLTISIIILVVFVVPQIVGGHDAYTTCIEGAFMIATTSILVAHGFSKRTIIAFTGAIITLLLTIGITSLSRYLTGLSGFIGEDSLSIAFSNHPISLSGLLFGGIIIASLGVLNDITIGQAAAVDEIYRANRALSSRELYRRGMSVGREHIAALVNTLALAYVAVALPVVVTTAIYNNAPLLVLFNQESVMEEVVRALVVSISLLLAVPVTTFLAAYIFPRWKSTLRRTITKLLYQS